MFMRREKTPVSGFNRRAASPSMWHKHAEVVRTARRAWTEAHARAHAQGTVRGEGMTAGGGGGGAGRGRSFAQHMSTRGSGASVTHLHHLAWRHLAVGLTPVASRVRQLPSARPTGCAVPQRLPDARPRTVFAPRPSLAPCPHLREGQPDHLLHTSCSRPALPHTFYWCCSPPPPLHPRRPTRPPTSPSTSPSRCPHSWPPAPSSSSPPSSWPCRTRQQLIPRPRPSPASTSQYRRGSRGRGRVGRGRGNRGRGRVGRKGSRGKAGLPRKSRVRRRPRGVMKGEEERRRRREGQGELLWP